MRVTLDLARLVDEGHLTQDEAERLARMGTPVTPAVRAAPTAPKPSSRVVVNVAMTFGALTVAAAAILLKPTPLTGCGIALLALLAGAMLLRRQGEDWALLAHALAIGGALGAGAGFLAALPEFRGGLLVVGLFLTAVALIFRSGIVAAFAPLAVGSWLGSGAGYWHATYSLSITQPLVTIAVFSLMAIGLLILQARLRRQATTLLIMARVSLFMANFGFWIGSLWGDDFRGGDVGPRTPAALSIPPQAFSVAWAVTLALVLIFGLRTGRRFVANTAIVFLGVHFYTQIFESFGTRPLVVLGCGILLVACAVGFLRFDRWQRTRLELRNANA